AAPSSVRLLLQMGSANVAGAERAVSPPTSSSLADDEACLLPPPQHGGARSGFDLPRSPSSLCLMARSARCDVRQEPPSSSDPTNRSCRGVGSVLQVFSRPL